MSELVNKVAEILNAPVDLVQRSAEARACLLYTSPSPRDMRRSRMPSSA